MHMLAAERQTYADFMERAHTLCAGFDVQLFLPFLPLADACAGSLTEAPDGDITAAAAVAVGGSTGCSLGFCCFQAPRPARLCAGDTVMDSTNGGRFGGRTNLAAAQDLPAAAVASSIKAERQCRWWCCW